MVDAHKIDDALHELFVHSGIVLGRFGLGGFSKQGETETCIVLPCAFNLCMRGHSYSGKSIQVDENVTEGNAAYAEWFVFDAR